MRIKVFVHLRTRLLAIKLQRYGLISHSVIYESLLKVGKERNPDNDGKRHRDFRIIYNMKLEWSLNPNDVGAELFS